jgi:hypothetical protein
MPKTWLVALKEWNSDKTAWRVPRKGTAEHAEILQRMKSDAQDPQTHIKKNIEGKKRARPENKPMTTTHRKKKVTGQMPSEEPVKRKNKRQKKAELLDLFNPGNT